MKIMNGKRRRGFALMFVIIIAAAMMIPVLMLISTTAPRKTNVTGEAISDRVLSTGDAVIDMILTKINGFTDLLDTDATLKAGLDNIAAYYTSNPPSDTFVIKRDAVKYTIGYLLTTLNGGTIWQPDGNTNPATKLQTDINIYPGPTNVIPGSVWDVEDNVATYLSNLETQTFYVLVTDQSGTTIKPVSQTGTNGDITNSYIKNLSNGNVTQGIQSIDPNYANDNKWVEIDANVQYVDDGTNKPNSTRYQIRLSSYLLTNSQAKSIKRNIFAEATLSTINANVNGVNTTGTSTVNPAFKNAIWSGKGLILNGNHTIQSGTLNSNGTISYDGKSGNGSIYASGQIILNGNNKIYGNIGTYLGKDQNGIIANGNLDLGTGHSLIYNQTQSLPDYSPGDENTFKAAAISGGIYPSNLVINASNSVINVNGGAVKYYINGTVNINGGNNTIRFSTMNNSPQGLPVDWYVNGDLNINGDTVIDFGNTPGIVWVNGYIHFNGNVTIKGSGTIIANKSVTFNGTTRSTYSDANSKLAIISRGQDSQGGIILNGNNTIYGLFYAPYSDIILNGTGDVFGALIAGGYVTSSVNGVIVNGNQDITYDKRFGNADDSSNPPLPGGGVTYTISGVKFAATSIYRLSWREIISKQVTNAYIQSLQPKFDFKNPS